MKRLGLDIGAETFKAVLLDDDGSIIKEDVAVHHGQAKASLMDYIATCDAIKDTTFQLAVTGSAASLFSEFEVGEIPAMTQGSKKLTPDVSSIIAIGAQSSVFISSVDRPVPDFRSNEHCAGGTGSFFQDQMSRLGLNIEDYSQVAAKATSVPRLSGRCAVFAKTDIIHRQQEGSSIPDILMGLAYAMVKNYKATIVRNLPVGNKVAFLGGVTKNTAVIKAITEVFGLEPGQLVVTDHAQTTEVLGAAGMAQKATTVQELLKVLASQGDARLLDHAPLPQGVENYHKDPVCSKAMPKEGVYLGIDIGSTSTDLLLMDKDGGLVDFLYLRTTGNPEKAVKEGLEEFARRYGSYKVIYSGITGSGRERLGKLLGVDVIKDEITAQAKAAVDKVKDTDTVFEIGGQDSKFISIHNGEVSDFQMNRICAAGTGSFIEEQAARLGIGMESFGEMALASKDPEELGERCTVFIFQSISSALSKGASYEDIAAGLCLSIVKNYLHKVVGGKPIGNHITLQGGVCYNPGIVAAFRSQFTGKEIKINPYFSISGAYGVAMLAKAEGTGESTFHGFEDFDQRVVDLKNSEEIKRNTNFYKSAGNLLLQDYDGSIDPNKKTVGIPFVLMIHKFFPLANAYFKELGFNVLLTDPTNEETIQLSQENAQGEICFPVKLIYGHMKQLINKKVDYIFLPTIHTIKHEKSHMAYNYGCMYMQSAPVSIARTMKIQEKGIQMLSPVFDLDMGKEAMAMAMVGMGVKLGFPKEKCLAAMKAGGMAVMKHTMAVEKQGQTLLASIKPEDKVLVLITRNYGVSDPILNMGIPKMLLERGIKVITLAHLPGHDLDLSPEFPNLCWPFGQHILSGAKLIKNHPNLYAVYLTNHGCGPDSMLSHLFKEIMGDKPYLCIEVDEHFSKVGVVTRVEAFLNALKHTETAAKPLTFDYTDVPFDAPWAPLTLEAKPCVLPNLGPYTAPLSSWISNETGLAVTALGSYTEADLVRGREETTSKEYLPFTLLTGSVINHLEQSVGNKQILIPGTLGSEADTQYGDVIGSIMRRKGFKASVAAPVVETLYKTAKDPMGFFKALLEGDAVCRKGDAGLKKLFAVGEPYTLFAMDGGVLDSIRGFQIDRAPLSEYVLFLWMDESRSSKDGFDFTPYLELLKTEAQKEPLRYSASLVELQKKADEVLPLINGGNIRYRAAKMLEISGGYCGILNVSPRYENAATIMEMRQIDRSTKVPCFNLAFDGDWDNDAQKRLNSFLFYM